MATKALTFTALKNQLGVDTKQLQKLIKLGLPWTGESRQKRFDPYEVRTWLIEKGLAEPNAPSADPVPETGIICLSQADAANELGVDRRKLAQWQTEPGFPFKPGTNSSIPDAEYVIDEIKAWLRVHHPNSKPVSSVDDERSAVRLETEKVRLEQARRALATAAGELVEIEIVERFNLRTHTALVTVFDQFPARVQAALSSELPEKDRQAAVRISEELVRELKTLAAELISGDRDEDEDLDEFE